MKIGIRMILCTVLAVVALAMAMFTLSGFTGRDDQPQALSDPRYVLGERDGSIAVFRSDDPDTPVTITNIQLATLREADRQMISAGLIAGSEDELLMLLEDLGS